MLNNTKEVSMEAGDLFLTIFLTYMSRSCAPRSPSPHDLLLDAD